MAFITGSDEITSIDVILFPNIYKLNFDIDNGDILYISAKVERRFDKYQLVVDNVHRL